MTDDHLSRLSRRVAAAARRHAGAAIRAGASAYDRSRDLPALIRLDPFAGLGDDGAATEAILARLDQALRRERTKARAGHWTYDLNRHIALRQAHRAETERLAALRRAAFPSGQHERRHDGEDRQEDRA